MKYLVIVLFLFTCVESMVVYSQNDTQYQNDQEQQSNINISERRVIESHNTQEDKLQKQDNPVADEALVVSIREKLAGLSMQFGEISITAKNGNVTVKGPLQSISEKIALIQAIQSVNGVKSVDAKGLMVPSVKTEKNPDSNNSNKVNETKKANSK